MHQPGPGTPARLAKEIIRRGIRLLSPPTRKFHVTLPSGLHVSFNAPRQFHIPRVRGSGELEPVTPKDAGKDQSERNWLFTTDPLTPEVLQRIHDWKRKIVA